MADGRADAGGAQGRRDSYHAGLTTQAVVDAAVELSGQRGLTVWSLRDLAQELGVAPSVIYHHAGGRETLNRLVAERVLGMVGLPTRIMPWRQWFREALFPIRPVLRSYPGTARWVLLHGPVLPDLVPVIDAGIASLRHDGFGQDAAIAYASLVNTALMMVAAADDRVLYEGDAPRDHASLIRGIEELSADSTGISLMTRDLLTQFTGSPERIAAAQDRYYRFVLERIMDGLELRLEAGGSL
ncbi:TetR/AcrR family transcriptional regulator [Propionibacterium australiense]|uniref:DNA-binding HTH domain, TetR-type n=1 Tax=Propionibacterium australiense TaxID=119981 RepID=A0A383S5C9_9ACTN|nr:TetR family transcriptional regulator [Propionibacterium australiense]RLP10109.1 TetR family transcriptional regulator [Propionibacterium australiense]RLP11395.1 TetR family transcriptional regulator [Propionibacterium australiense]SYZ32921.1 DNA-binding HTH domain, TetR-type [Propionibacterium australiense]VEH92427.1 Bacterial regulatory proteins, tetR family [Propionibacterium australiense]